MVLARNLVQFAEVEKAREFVKVEHRLVLAVLAKECDVFAEVHVLEVICNKTTVAALYALAEIVQDVFLMMIFHKLFEILSYWSL